MNIQPRLITTFAATLAVSLLGAGPLALAQENTADPAKQAAPARPRSGAPRGPHDGRIPKLPAAISSFGAAIANGSLYVYSGHIGKAHAHSRDNLADGFWRFDLQKGTEWESLPMREKLQGLALVAWKDSVIRIGGVTARNPAGEKSDMHSTAEVERFDVASNSWVPMTPMPEPRSSFDAVVVGDKLYVIGGWALSGSEKTGTWCEKNYVADLTADPISWQPLPDAPFRHRALAVAAAGGKIFAIGGLDRDGESTQEVYVFDIASNQWSKGPDFPGDGRLKGFGASAFGVGDKVWASGAEGKVYSITPEAKEWHDAQYALETPRFFHRLLPSPRGTLLFIGGAAMKKGHQDNVEQVELALLEAQPATTLPAPAAPQTSGGDGQANWPGFRGDGNSHTSARNLPLQWSDEENIAWSVQLPGYGQSSPVIWGDRVFVTSVEGDRKEKLSVQCYDLRTGEQVWVHRLDSAQPLALTDYISKGAPTPVVDAERVYAFFESGDIVALDREGKVAWQRSLAKEYGEPKGNHGLGSSLAQTPEAVIVLVDHAGPSYLLAIDKKTGANLWKNDRPERVAWSTPLVIERGGAREIVVSSSGSVEGFDAATGRQLWSIAGLKGNNVPSPTAANDWILVGSSDRDNTVAVRHTGGTNAELAWKAAQASVSFGSPLVVGDAVFSVNKAGVAFCNDLSTGALRWSLRLPDSCWASPLAAGENIYFFSKNGATTVLRNGTNGPEKVAESKLTVTGRVYGVAAVDGAIVVRTGDRLVRLGKPAS